LAVANAPLCSPQIGNPVPSSDDRFWARGLCSACAIPAIAASEARQPALHPAVRYREEVALSVDLELERLCGRMGLVGDKKSRRSGGLRVTSFVALLAGERPQRCAGRGLADAAPVHHGVQ
jgi:hypothetical protein